MDFSVINKQFQIMKRTILLFLMSCSYLIICSQPNLEIDHNGSNPVQIKTNSTDNYSSYFTNGIYQGYLGIYTGDRDMDFGTGFGNNTGKVHLVTGATPKLTVLAGGNVGVGTTNPTYNFQVNGWAESDWIRVNGNGDGSAWRLGVQGNAMIRGQNLFLENSTGSKTIKLTNIGTVNDIISDGADLNIAADGGKNINFFGYGRTGGVTIGTNDLPTGYKLSVDGKIISEEVLVELSGAWPDYVFDKEYNLMPLSDLAQYIESNNHLPNIPSANVVESEGITLGAMQTLTIEKVEELTLYILQLEKRIAELENSKK